MMIKSISPYELVKVLLIGVFFGYQIGRWRYKRMKAFEFANLRFGDLGDKKGIKL
jgi:hypothetical protein